MLLVWNVCSQLVSFPALQKQIKDGGGGPSNLLYQNVFKCPEQAFQKLSNVPPTPRERETYKTQRGGGKPRFPAQCTRPDRRKPDWIWQTSCKSGGYGEWSQTVQRPTFWKAEPREICREEWPNLPQSHVSRPRKPAGPHSTCFIAKAQDVGAGDETGQNVVGLIYILLQWKSATLASQWPFSA